MFRLGAVVRWLAPKTPARIKWADPPPAGRGPEAHDATVPDRLRARPGKWALIKTSNQRNSALIYARSRRDKWGVEFEVVTRGKDTYARFVPLGFASEPPPTRPPVELVFAAPPREAKPRAPYGSRMNQRKKTP